MRVAAVLPLLILIAADPLRAQIIAGRVLDLETRRPLSGHVVAARDSSGAAARVKADSTGTFYLFLPRGGLYQLTFGPDELMPIRVDSIAVGADEMVQQIFAIPIRRVYFEFEVETTVRQIPGTGLLRYPDELRTQGVQGEVLVQFVVDTTGRALSSTFKVLRSSDRQFTQAVRMALPGMRFIPAFIGDKKVIQLVQQPFTFTLQ